MIRARAAAEHAVRGQAVAERRIALLGLRPRERTASKVVDPRAVRCLLGAIAVLERDVPHRRLPPAAAVPVQDGRGSVASENRLLLGRLLAPVFRVLAPEDQFLAIGDEMVVAPTGIRFMDLREVVDAGLQDDRGTASKRSHVVCQRRHVARLDCDSRSCRA